MAGLLLLGVQSLFDGVRVGFVNTSSGNLTFRRRDIVARAQGPVVHDSRIAGNADFGPGWRLSLAEELLVDGDAATYVDESGVRHAFAWTGTAWTASPPTPRHAATTLAFADVDGLRVAVLADGDAVRTFRQADAAGARYVVRLVRTPARELALAATRRTTAGSRARAGATRATRTPTRTTGGWSARRRTAARAGRATPPRACAGRPANAPTDVRATPAAFPGTCRCHSCFDPAYDGQGTLESCTARTCGGPNEACDAAEDQCACVAGHHPAETVGCHADHYPDNGCPDPHALNADGACVPSCPSRSTADADGHCRCEACHEDATAGDGSLACAAKSCSPGTRCDPATNQCEPVVQCPDGCPDNARCVSGECRCDPCHDPVLDGDGALSSCTARCLVGETCNAVGACECGHPLHDSLACHGAGDAHACQSGEHKHRHPLSDCFDDDHDCLPNASATNHADHAAGTALCDCGEGFPDDPDQPGLQCVADDPVDESCGPDQAGTPGLHGLRPAQRARRRRRGLRGVPLGPGGGIPRPVHAGRQLHAARLVLAGRGERLRAGRPRAVQRPVRVVLPGRQRRQRLGPVHLRPGPRVHGGGRGDLRHDEMRGAHRRSVRGGPGPGHVRAGRHVEQRHRALRLRRRLPAVRGRPVVCGRDAIPCRHMSAKPRWTTREYWHTPTRRRPKLQSGWRRSL